MGSTEVYILGQKYTIKGDEPEEYIRDLASFVDKKLKEVYNSSPNITPVKASILAALDIADELFKMKIQQEEATKISKRKPLPSHRCSIETRHPLSTVVFEYRTILAMTGHNIYTHYKESFRGLPGILLRVQVCET